MRFDRKGFTLIELIIVIVIIGVLASVAAPMMTGVKAKAIISEALTGLSAVRTSCQQYRVEYGGYHTYYGGSVAGIALNHPEIFPGLSFRPFTDDPGASSLDGTYFSEESYIYEGFEGNRSGPDEYAFIAVTANSTIWSSATNKAPKHDEANATTDDPTTTGAYIIRYFTTGKIKQKGWSKSGYPVDNPPGQSPN